MKGQDIVVLLKLVSLHHEDDEHPFVRLYGEAGGEDAFSVRGLAVSLGISKSEISASIKRSIDSHLATRDHEHNRPRPVRRNLVEFLTHGLKFVFPAKVGSVQRGIPTAFAAPVLEGRLMSAGDSVYVWPHAEGRDKGQALEPLFTSVPEAVARDSRLYEYLALVDAIRLGNQREAKFAEAMLTDRIIRK